MKDVASIFGVALTLGAVYLAIVLEGSHVGSVLLVAPMILVIFGSLGATIIGATFKDVGYSFKSLGSVFFGKVDSPQPTIDLLVSMAGTAANDGRRALESRIGETDDPFIISGLEGIVDSMDSDALEDRLYDQMDAAKKQEKVAVNFFKNMGGYSPTIGIVGTVISLVHVLENLAEPEELGHLIAAAFVATLWGILMANVFWLPFSNRLARLSELRQNNMEIAAQGILAINGGTGKRALEERLNGMLPRSAKKRGAPSE